jgi:hypothetical protein
VPGLRALCGWGRCNLYIAHVIFMIIIIMCNVYNI